MKRWPSWHVQCSLVTVACLSGRGTKFHQNLVNRLRKWVWKLIAHQLKSCPFQHLSALKVACSSLPSLPGMVAGKKAGAPGGGGPPGKGNAEFPPPGPRNLMATSSHYIVFVKEMGENKRHLGISCHFHGISISNTSDLAPKGGSWDLASRHLLPLQESWLDLSPNLPSVAEEAW